MDPTLAHNYHPSDQPLFKTRIPNQALSVYTYHNDSPPLAPADSSRRYSESGARWGQDGSHGSFGSPEQAPPTPLDLSSSVDDSSAGYASGSEESADKATDSDPANALSLNALSIQQSAIFAIPPPTERTTSGDQRNRARPLHASPDSRPPARARQHSIDAGFGRMFERSVSFGGGGSRCMRGHSSADDTKDGSDKVPIQSTSMAEYEFPRHRLPIKLRDETKVPLVIVACGSFSPCTYLHLRIFEMAKDAVFEGDKFEILAGYYSPVGDAYRKSGLAAAHHRVRMCELAVENTSSWLMVDAWESLQSEYTRTADVLDHFDQEINADGGIVLSDGSRRKVRIMLLAGGDLIQSFGEPGVWSEPDLVRILGGYGCLVVERTGSDVWAFLLSHDILWRYRENCIVIKQLIYNDISSTKVRLFVRRRMSIKYLLPSTVINYIEAHRLYASPEPLQPPTP